MSIPRLTTHLKNAGVGPGYMRTWLRVSKLVQPNQLEPLALYLKLVNGGADEEEALSEVNLSDATKGFLRKSLTQSKLNAATRLTASPMVVASELREQMVRNGIGTHKPIPFGETVTLLYLWDDVDFEDSDVLGAPEKVIKMFTDQTPKQIRAVSQKGIDCITFHLGTSFVILNLTACTITVVSN